MNFIHEITGASANVPWSKEESKSCGYTRYMDDQGCKICGTEAVGRYVADNTCVNCALRDAAQIWQLWKMGSPDRPEKFPLSAKQAVEMGVDYFYTEPLCKGGVHFVQPHIKTGRCVACEKLKPLPKGSTNTALMEAMPDMVLQKADALALGMDVFRTGEPCGRGHRAWRYVSNGGCIACMRGNKEPAFEPVDDGRVITVAEQMQIFIGYGWDGRRVIDPDGKRYTVAQFNIMVGGEGRYEVIGGRPDVFTSHEAFMQNFGPRRIVR